MYTVLNISVREEAFGSKKCCNFIISSLYYEKFILDIEIIMYVAQFT